MSHKQNTVKSMVITRFFRSANFVLQAQYYSIRIRYRQWLHAMSLALLPSVRNYL